MYYYSIFQQLFKFVPRYRFEKSVEKHSGDRYCKHFTAIRQLKTVLYAQLAGKDSLREVESGRLMNAGRRKFELNDSFGPSVGTGGPGPDDLIADLKTFGLLFETLCVRDLRVFAEALDGQVYHYRDRSGLECDAVVHLRNGSYGLIEIKLGGEKLISEGAANLLALSGKIDADKMKRPSFQMVLTGIGDYAYRRKDGVYVVPIGCLKN